MTADQPDLQHRTIPANGISFHAAEAGPGNGPLVLLLHGFPDFWYTWKLQLPFLAAHGYRVVAPDQRGYNRSDKPAGLGAYNIDVLAADAVAILDSLGCERAIVAGHDWGGSVAWRVAQLHPERVEKLVILNVPHSTVLKRALRSSWKQKMRSWYAFGFQAPLLPEWILAAFNYSVLARSRSAGGALSPEDLQRYREAWSQPGALHGMIQWYRALLRTKARRIPDPVIQPPVLLVWGARDPYLGRELAAPSIEFCRDGTLSLLEDAGHWVHHDAPDEVNRRILAFLRGQA